MPRSPNPPTKDPDNRHGAWLNRNKPLSESSSSKMIFPPTFPMPGSLSFAITILSI